MRARRRLHLTPSLHLPSLPPPPCQTSGKPTAKVIEEIADIYAFIGDQTKTPCKRA